MEFRAAPVDAVAVRKRQGINKPTRSGIDAYHALGPFGRGDGIIWGVPGPAIIAIGGFELRLGENVSGLVAEVNSLAVGIYQPNACKAGRLLLQLPEEIGSIEGVLGTDIG